MKNSENKTLELIHHFSNNWTHIICTCKLKLYEILISLFVLRDFVFFYLISGISVTNHVQYLVTSFRIPAEDNSGVCFSPKYIITYQYICIYASSGGVAFTSREELCQASVTRGDEMTTFLFTCPTLPDTFYVYRNGG